MLEHHHIQVNSDIYALAQLQEWFQQFQNLLPKPTWMQCNLVLVEVFTNVVSYAHEGLPEETPVDIEITLDKTKFFLELKIWDFGEPFDLQAEIERAAIESQKNKDFESIDDIPTGGRGLMIAKTVADEIRYETSPDGRNCFVMSKNFAKLV
ncbi:anti-sigma regulatory factor [Pseudanabaena sp. SR411]|uniref:ATP-binding protein n=1 Tax=Pseudanabaena sp. SR411 TaxID=1980935 RepID=UPI000B994AFF|nr:anti-sigma regulatory factor [Pseudanabaena sp. SR411]OYQ66172.1 anti-sigma regulatory factor [Pseudanabaena sp. SR411]